MADFHAPVKESEKERDTMHIMVHRKCCLQFSLIMLKLTEMKHNVISLINIFCDLFPMIVHNETTVGADI